MKPPIGLDIDGVLAEYRGWQGIDHIGDPIPGAVNFTKQLAKLARIVIYTTRCKEYPLDTPGPPGAADPDRRPVLALVEIIREWLDKHGFTYDSIYSGQGKPFFVAMIDDRAVTCRPQESHTPEFEYQFALAAVAVLCDKLRQGDVSKTVLDADAKGR